MPPPPPPSPQPPVVASPPTHRPLLSSCPSSRRPPTHRPLPSSRPPPHPPSTPLQSSPPRSRPPDPTQTIVSCFWVLYQSCCSHIARGCVFLNCFSSLHCCCCVLLLLYFVVDACNGAISTVQRRLAQNHEAARKSCLRKKAYVQQLESSRLKLVQLEQELDRARQQGLYVGGAVDASQLGFGGPANPGIATFEMEYGHWLEEQNRHICDMRIALNAHKSDIELRLLVESDMSLYFELFRLKATAAKADVFYVMSGLWKSPAERFFLWIGGFRPSELLKILVPCMHPLTEQQVVNVSNLRQSCQQAEDALSQGMEKLQQNVAETLAAGQLSEASYLPRMETAIEKLEDLVRYVQQADHLRQETLQQMFQILTTRQAAQGLLALGEYLQRLRALSSLWAPRPHEPAYLHIGTL